jgi:hypothetical protein
VPPSSRCLFLLATSVEPTVRSDDPDARARVKQAAVLYDELLFERGALQVNVGEDGTLETHRSLDENEDPGSVLCDPPGVAHHAISVRVDVEDSGETVVFDEMLTSPYAAELEYSVFAELHEFNTGWALAIEPRLPEEPEMLIHLPRKGISPQLTRDERLAVGWQDYVGHHARRAAPLAVELDAAVSASGPVARALAPNARQTAASRALAAAVPDVTSLPWERVMDFREHPAAAEARERLWRLAADLERGPDPAAVIAFERDLHSAEREVMRRTRRHAKLGRIALSLTGLGAIAAVVGELADPFAERLAARGGWPAAIGLLRDP